MDKRPNFDPAGLTLVSALVTRYKIVKSVIYKRLNDLGVRPQKIGIRAYVTEPQLSLLDAHHEFIQAGGNTAEFLFYQQNKSDENEESDR